MISKKQIAISVFVVIAIAAFTGIALALGDDSFSGGFVPLCH
jgi:preprotein translocase subunit SecE